MNKAQDSDTPRVNAVVKAGESLTNASALSELAMLARTLERELATERRRVKQLEDALYLSRGAHDIAEKELAAERKARVEAEADAQSWADQKDESVKHLIRMLERAERAEAKLRELENSLYLSQEAHDIAEQELAVYKALAMKEAK